MRGVSSYKLRQMSKWIAIYKEINVEAEKAKSLEKKATHSIIQKADVVCATNNSSGNDLLVEYKFDTVVLDEASQAIEPSCLISMLHAEKWILAGDHHQLPQPWPGL